MANAARAQEEAEKNSTTTNPQNALDGLAEENKNQEESTQDIINTDPQPDSEPPVEDAAEPDSEPDTPPSRGPSETYNLEAEVERFVNNLLSPLTSTTTDAATLAILTGQQAAFSILLYDDLKDLPPESQQWVETFLETGNYGFEEFPFDKLKTLKSIDASKNWGKLSPDQQSAMTNYLSSSIDGYDNMTDTEKTAALETQWNGMYYDTKKTAVNIEKVNTVTSGIQDIYSTLSQEISQNTGVDMAKSDVIAGSVFGAVSTISNAMAFDWENATPEQKAAQGVSIASDFVNTIDDIDFATILGAISPQLLPIGMTINTLLDTIGPWLEKFSSGLDKIQEQQEKEKEEQQAAGTTDVIDEEGQEEGSEDRSTSADGQATDETSMDSTDQTQEQDEQTTDQDQEDEEDLNKTTVTRQTVYNKDGDVTRDVTVTSVTNVDESGKITETRTCAWTVPDNWAPQTNVKTTEKDDQGNTTIQYTFWDGDNQYTETTVIDKEGNTQFTDRDGNMTETLATAQVEEDNSVVVTMGSGDTIASNTYSFGGTSEQEAGASR
ncbi:MAG: hypothetical protein O3A66_00560 [Proteobacteria bacterium]|nr:hypothetical protein [Pseudomonadota bacterium]